jgi:hypothetical protein
VQRSEDGFYWWDGDTWQLIPEDERSSGPAAPGPAGDGGMTLDELSLIKSEDQLDERSAPYFHPDYDMYPDGVEDAEGADVLSDEPAAGGN